ncbi:MAG: T9SS type A sorting domain-containing protein [Bacteroidota bacterium]
MADLVCNQQLNGHTGNVYYDPLVVAKNYIWPIADGSLGWNEQEGVSFTAFPNPANETLNFSRELDGLKIVNNIGQVMYQSDEKITSVSTRDLKPGIYFLHCAAGNLKFSVNH